MCAKDGSVDLVFTIVVAMGDRRRIEGPTPMDDHLEVGGYVLPWRRRSTYSEVIDPC